MKKFLIGLTLLALTACASLQGGNPFMACKTAGQCYLAVTGTYNAAQIAALKVVESQATPAAAKAVIKKAEGETFEALSQLTVAYRAYLQAKTDLAAGKGTEAKLTIATKELDKWLKTAGPLVAKLAELVGDMR